MREVVQHPVYGEIVYTESFWAGKKTIAIDGVEAKKISKKEYVINGKRGVLKGSYFTGISLYIEGEAIQVSPKTKWYEFFFAALPFLFLMTWGNIATLCEIFPVVGGLIGGALGGAAVMVSLLFMKKQKSPLFKILIGIAVCAVTIFIAFIMAIAIIKLMN